MIDLTRYHAVKKCQNCGSCRSYTNPLWKCFECHKRFCPDCIFGGQLKTGMKEGETLRDTCGKCKIAGEYKSLISLPNL